MQEQNPQELQGLLQMVQQLIPGYSGKAVDDRVAAGMAEAGVAVEQQAQPEMPMQQEPEGLLQQLQMLLQQQQ